MILGMTKYDKFVAISLIIEFMSHKNPYKRPLLKSNRSHHSQLKLPMVDKKLSYDVKQITKVKSGKLACHKVKYDKFLVVRIARIVVNIVWSVCK